MHAPPFVHAILSAEPYLRAYIRRFPRSATQEDDIIQATWLAAWDHRSQFSGRGSPKAWLFRICQSEIRRLMSCEQRFPTAPLAPDEIGDTSGPTEADARA